MPDQLVVRRWARHGRRNTALATGFGVDSPIRPATSGTLGTTAPPAGSTPPASSQPGAFATAPWVAAAVTRAAAPAVPLIGRRPGAPATPGAASSGSPAAPTAWTPGTYPGAPAGPRFAIPATPGALPSPYPARPASPASPDGAAPSSAVPTDAPGTPLADFGGVWAPAPGSPRESGSSAPTDAAPGHPGSATPGSTHPGSAHPSSAAPGSSALLRTLPVAPPRTGPISAEPPAPPTSALAAPGTPSTPSTPSGAAFGAPPVPATFSQAEIEQIRSGTGSLLERTAHLFGAGPGPAPSHQPDRSTGGSAVFHQTSTDGLVPAPAGPGTAMGDPWAAGPPIPASAFDTGPAPEEIEPSGATLDRIVDAVVERIEDRVIDELERRGRHEWRVV